MFQATSLIPAPRRRRSTRKRLAETNQPPVGQPPVLIGVLYESMGGMMLRFDRAVDVAGINVTKIVVSDAMLGQVLRGEATAGQQTQEDVIVLLSAFGPSVGPGVTLTVGAGNGVVAVEGGGEWAGVTDVEIPFP